MYKIFPHVVVDDMLFIDGSMFKFSSFCKNKQKACNDYYKGIYANDGFHICPFGFTSYVGENENRSRFIITGVRIQDKYNKKKFKQRHIDAFFPEIPLENFLNSLSQHNKITKQKVSASMLDALSDAIHEIRKLNGEIKYRSEKINKDVSQGVLEYICNDIQDIFAQSSLISTRLNFFDFEANPDLITEHKNIVEIRKKFDKVRYCMNSLCRKKNMNIDFRGTCYSRIEAYSVFDLLPYVLLENALKYTPDQQDIEVEFNESGNHVEIITKNIGPLATPEDLEQVFLPKRRGQYASKNFSGTGTGLYFAKKICTLHDINIEISSEQTPKFIIDGVPYSNFRVKTTMKTTDRFY